VTIRLGSRVRNAAVAAVCVVVLVTACGPAHHAAAPLTGPALANATAGSACAWLVGAEQRPAGSAQAPVGQAMLAHAVTLALQAKSVDARWKRFATDMGAIGTPNGSPSLKRVTTVCTQWTKDRTYYLTHPPQ